MTKRSIVKKCPFCRTKLKEETKEIFKGVFAKVEVCPKCEDEWVSGEEHDKVLGLFQRKAFLTGGSLAVRIPKEIVKAVKIKEGTTLNFRVAKKKVIIEPT